MIIETSALVAIVLDEPAATRLLQAIGRDTNRTTSAANYVEASIVLGHADADAALATLDEMITRLGIEVAPFDVEQARIARDAYREFRRGSGHPARLNFGDCFSYALARVTREPLLVTGDDFAQTGIDMVTWQ